MEGAATIGSGIEIRASTIPGGGNGLFTSRLFHKNELITEYFGPIIDHEKAKKLRKQNKHSHVRVLTIQFQYIDGIKQPRPGVGGASFANDARDSQKNNAVFVCRHDHKLGRDRVYLKATRELPPGTEVFVGYGRDYWRNSKKPPASPPKQQPADREQAAENPQQQDAGQLHMRTRSGGRKHPQQQQQQQQRVQEQQEQATQNEPLLQPPARLVQEAPVQADGKQAIAAAAAGGAAVAAAQLPVLAIQQQQPAAGHIPVRSSWRVKQRCQQQQQQQEQELEQQQSVAAAAAIVQQQQQEEQQQQEQDLDKESLLQAPAQLAQELPVQAISRRAAAADAAVAMAQLQLLAIQPQQQQQQPAAGHMQICSSSTTQSPQQQKQQQAAAAAAVVQQPEQQAAVAAAAVVQQQKQQAAVAAAAVVQQQQAQLARSTMQPDPVQPAAAAAQAAALQSHGQLAPPPPQPQQQHLGHSDTQLDPAAAAAAAVPVAAVHAALLQLHQQQAQQPAQLLRPMQPGAGHMPVCVPRGTNMALAGFVPLLPLGSNLPQASAVLFGYVTAPQPLNPFVQHAASRTDSGSMFVGVNVPQRQRSRRTSRTSSTGPAAAAAAAAALEPWQVAAALAAPTLLQQQQQQEQQHEQHKQPRQGSFDSSEAENTTLVEPDWGEGQREGEETAAAAVAGQELYCSGENPSMQHAASHADSGFLVHVPRRQRSTRASWASSRGFVSSGDTQRPPKRSCVSVYRDKRRSVKCRFVAAAKRPFVAAEQVAEADPDEGNPYRRVYTHARRKAAVVHDGTDEDSSEEGSTSSEEEEDVGEADTPTAVGAAAAAAVSAAAAAAAAAALPAAALPAAAAAASGDVEGVSRSDGNTWRPLQKRSRAPRAMNAAAAEDCPPEVQQALDEGNPYKRVYRRNWADLQDANAGGDVDGDADWEPDGDADEDATDWEPGSQCHVAGGDVVSSSGKGLCVQKRSYVSINYKAKAHGVVEECAPKVQKQPDEGNLYQKVYRRSWGVAQDGDAGMPSGGRGCGTPAGRRRRGAGSGGFDSSGGKRQLQARSCASVYRAK